MCMARIWGDGLGRQCQRSRKLDGRFCGIHQNDQAHGAVDGPVPPEKLQKMEAEAVKRGLVTGTSVEGAGCEGPDDKFKWLGDNKEKRQPQAFRKPLRTQQSYDSVLCSQGHLEKIQVGDVLRAARAGERAFILGEVCELTEGQRGKQMLLRQMFGPAELRGCSRDVRIEENELVDSKKCLELPLAAAIEKVQVLSEEDYLKFMEDESVNLASLSSGPFLCRRQLESSETLWPARWDANSRKQRREACIRAFRGEAKAVPKRQTPAVGGKELLMTAAAALKTGSTGMLPGRESEQERVMEFLRTAVKEGGRKEVLYVSGVPGTGKTASVLEVVRRLQSARTDQIQFAYVNAMSLATPTAVFGEICRKVHPTKRDAAEGEARETLRRALTERLASQVTILVIDEVDALLTKAQSVLYQLFDWVSHPAARLAVVAIANTMDLPERLLPRVASRIGVQRVSFNAYSRDQLKAILVNRLSAVHALDAFQDKALTICAARVAADGGDARKALQVCRRAIEASLSKEEPVSFEQMMAAEAELLQLNPTAMAIKGLQLKARRLLLAMVLELRRKSTHVLPLHKVLRRFQGIMQLHEQRKACEDIPKEPAFMARCWDEGKDDLIPRLQAVGIVSLNKAGSNSSEDNGGHGQPVLEFGQSLDVEDVANALNGMEDELANELLAFVEPGPVTLN
ncbi:unnamed protein product [Effrenium voratum]|nr:unnamed protein product [Effrenium voratum]